MNNNNMQVVHSSGEKKKATKQEEQKLYEVLKKLPAPKKEMNLTTDQRKWWYWFGRELLTSNQLMKFDLVYLRKAAVSMDKSSKILAKINKLNDSDTEGIAGWVQTFKNKTNNVTGYSTAYKEAEAELEKLSKHFGGSMFDRIKLKVEKVDSNQLSLFESVMQKLEGNNLNQAN